MAVIHLPGGINVHTFPPPPPELDLMNLSDDDLARLGLPPRPPNGKLLHRWEALFRGDWEYVQAELESSGRRRHKQRGGSRVSAGPDDENSWSGVALDLGLGSGNTVRAIVAEWIVPTVQSPKGQSLNNNYRCASWIGIGNFRYDAYTLQAGVETDVVPGLVAEGEIQSTTVFWEFALQGFTEATPYQTEQVVKNLTAKPGDRISIAVCTWQTQPWGGIYIRNVTTKKVTSFSVNPTGAVGPLNSPTAEWIVERPLDGNTDTVFDLPAYGQVLFQNAFALDANNALIDPHSTKYAVPINMQDKKTQNILSTGELTGNPEEVLCQCTFN